MSSEASKPPLPPGKSGWPILGETLPFLKNGFAFIDQKIAAHGPVFRMKFLGRDTAVLAGPDGTGQFIDARHVMREGAMPPHVQEIFGGRSLPLLDGGEHSTRKRQVLAGFGRAALTSYLPGLQGTVESSFARWAAAGEIRACTEWKRLALAGIARNVLSLEEGPTLDALVDSFGALTRGFAGLPIPLPGTAYTGALKARDRIFAVLEEEVKRHRATPMDDGLSRILAAKAEDGTTIGDHEVVMELHHVNIAGYIVFAELTTMLVELEAHPEVRDRLRTEIRAHAPSGPLTLEQLAGMQYLGQVVKEVKRVAPILPVIFGKAREDFVHDGYLVPKGWMVFWGLRATNYHKETFAEAERFDPDRFSSARAEDTKHPHGFVPQGAGPEMGHKCPGTDYATLFMQIFATVLLRGHTWELAPGQDLSLDWSKIPPEQKDGLRVTFRAG